MFLLRLFLILPVLCLTAPIDGNYDCGSCPTEQCVKEDIGCCIFCSATISCSTEHISVAIPREATRASVGDLSFADRSCGATQNATHFILSSKPSECGTVLQRIKDSHFIYRNEIRHKNGYPVYALSCKFNRNIGPRGINIKVVKEPIDEIKLYHTTSRGRRLNRLKFYLESQGYLFFEVKAPVSLRIKNTVMGVIKCHLEISENSNIPKSNPTIDPLIENGCPTKTSVKFIQQSDYNLWFSYLMDNVKQERNDTAVLNCDARYCSKTNTTLCTYDCD